MNVLEFNQSIVKFANKNWHSVATAIDQAHRTETLDARIRASAAIAASTRTFGRFDSTHELDDLAALSRILAAFHRVNDLA